MLTFTLTSQFYRKCRFRNFENKLKNSKYKMKGNTNMPRMKQENWFIMRMLWLTVELAGKMPPVLASREVGQIPVLCGGPHGRVQHAPVHPERI